MNYFTESEFICPCCGGLPESGMSLDLIKKLNKLRELWGKAIIVVSGFRCRDHNAEIHGAKYSRHCLGKAADLADPDGKLEEFITEDLLRQLGFSREEPAKTRGYVHLDVDKRGGEWGTFKV